MRGYRELDLSGGEEIGHAPTRVFKLLFNDREERDRQVRRLVRMRCVRSVKGNDYHPGGWMLWLELWDTQERMQRRVELMEMPARVELGIRARGQLRRYSVGPASDRLLCDVGRGEEE